MINSYRKWILLCFYFFSRMAAVAKISRVVQ